MNIHRQLKDILIQGQRFKNLDYVNAASVNEFNQYAQEIKDYLSLHSKNELIQERLNEIKNIHYNEIDLPVYLVILSILFLPVYGFSYLREYKKKKACSEQILEIVSIFASIEFLYKNE